MKVIFEKGDYRLEVDEIRGVGRFCRGDKCGPEITLSAAPRQLIEPHRKALNKMGKNPAEYSSIGGQIIRYDAIPAWMVAHKAELKRMKAKREADKAALETAVPGLTELMSAISAEEDYRIAFNRMMEDEDNDGVNPPPHPTGRSSREIARDFPKAALYLKAETYERAANYHKVSAGKKAKALIRAGGDLEEAQEIMDNWLPPESVWR